MKRLMLSAILMVLVGFCSMAYAIDPNNKAWNQKEALSVKNPEGEYLGTAKDILVSPSGTVAFIIISIGEKGEKDVAVPLGIFLYDRQNKVLILKMSKEQIAAAPEFNVKGVYEFFGVAPPWTDTAPQDRGGK